MTLLLARTPFLSKPIHYSALPRVRGIVSSGRSMHHRTIFDFRFLTLMAICGSFVGSLFCFLKGCGYICESFMAYYRMRLSGRHTGKVILRLVEAVDVYLVGTAMLIFGMGLYGLFISNEPKEGQSDRALKNTTLFGLFPLTAMVIKAKEQ